MGAKKTTTNRLKNSVYHILSRGTPEEKLELLQILPENTMKETAKTLIALPNPLTSIFGFGSLLPSYCHGASCETGELLSIALYQYGKELFTSGDFPNVHLSTVIDFAYSYIKSLTNLSKCKEAYTFIENELPFWESYEKKTELLAIQDQDTFPYSLKSVLIAKINLLIELNCIDEAFAMAYDNPSRLEGGAASDIELERLRTKLGQIKPQTIKLAKTSEERKDDHKKSREHGHAAILDGLGKILAQNDMDPRILDGITSADTQDPYTRTGFDALEKTISTIETSLQGESSEENEISIQGKIRRASGIFVDNQPAEDQILNSLEVLKKSLESSLRLKNKTLINDSYFGLYLCYSRLNRSSEAADQLINLRKNLESIRKGIENPLERSGVFQLYPYLFYSLAEHLYIAKRDDDLLDAIEASKGRVIIDTIEKESKLEFGDYYLDHITERLRPLLLKENAHYISYHVDDNCSYACLITKQGNIYAHKISLGKNHLNTWYARHLHNPMNWNTAFGDITKELTPFVSLLETYIHEGIIEKNDHICYAADHLLYLFPLQYVKIGGKPLIELNTVSRVHNAGHLLYLLSKPPKRPDCSLTIEVPSSEDIEKEEVTKALGHCSELLQQTTQISGKDHLHHKAASLHAVLSGFQNNQLIHFTTHGFFPADNNPFDHSGLLLPSHGKLPTLFMNDLNFKYKNEGEHLLSPERLLKTRQIQLNNSHISMQACVAGYAREGIGGDALGIEWAFLQKGADSLISTFWNIDLYNSNEFYTYFYEEWLENGSSKAVAHQHAILKLKESCISTHVPDEYFWAGYGLIGDWR